MRIKSYIIQVVGIIFCIQISAHAVNPRDGWYAGIFLGPSATNSNDFDFGGTLTFTGPNVTVSGTSGKLTYSVLGDVGGSIGYRFCTRMRVEGELLYNNNPIKTLQINNFTVTNAYAPSFNVTNTTAIFTNTSNTSDAHIQGDTNTGAFMFNFFYDLYSQTNDGYSKVVPFVGVGIGYAYVQNALQFYRATSVDPALDPYTNREVLDVLQKRYIYAGQALLGINYFMDDFTWLTFDVRYFTTGSSNVSSGYTYTSPTEAKTILSPFSLFPTKTSLISANIGFSGSFDYAK